MTVGSPALIWRSERVRLRGFTTRPCCDVVEVRATSEFMDCVGCGTQRTWTEDGFPVTLFGEKYLTDVRERQPIPVEIKMRMRQSV